MMKTITLALSCLALGALLAITYSAVAHTPCSTSPPVYEYETPRCEYVQAINPYSGILETHYVCE